MIKSIDITNYKSLAGGRIHFSPVTVLVGRSGAGKSNFVDAFRFIRECLQSQPAQAAGNRGGWPKVVNVLAGEPARLSFEITFDLRGVSGDFCYLLALGGHHQREPLAITEERLSLDGKPLYHQQAGKWICTPTILPTPPLGTSEPMLKHLSGIREVALAHLVLTDGLGCHDFPGTVLTRSGPSSAQETRLDDAADGYLAVIRGISGNLDDLGRWNEIVAALRRLNPTIQSVELAMPGRDRVVVGHRAGEKTLLFELAQESEGFRRFLAHLLALYQTPPRRTLVFEEPEKGIHPGALAVLAEELRACPDAGRGQVVLTTHSPDLLDHFDADQVRVVELDARGTRVGSVAPEQLEAVRERLLTTGELLTVDPARVAS